jgi:hypothetical protein
MKSYSHASDDVARHIERMREEYYSPDLDGVTVDALFVFDLEATEPVLTHGGYPAQAVCRLTPVRDRALGVADVVIVIDRSNWITLTGAERDALIDHELHHIERVLEEETEVPKTDAVDRPKLRLRKHDHQFGWFDAIAERHADASPEIRQAKSLMAKTGQMYLDFGKVPRSRGRNPTQPPAAH